MENEGSKDLKFREELQQTLLVRPGLNIDGGIFSTTDSFLMRLKEALTSSSALV